MSSLRPAHAVAGASVWSQLTHSSATQNGVAGSSHGFESLHTGSGPVEVGDGPVVSVVVPEFDSLSPIVPVGPVSLSVTVPGVAGVLLTVSLSTPPSELELLLLPDSVALPESVVAGPGGQAASMNNVVRETV